MMQRCISLLHYCKSLVGVLQASCFPLNLFFFFLMLHCGADRVCDGLKSSSSTECRLSFRSPKVGAIVTNNAERPTSVQHGSQQLTGTRGWWGLRGSRQTLGYFDGFSGDATSETSRLEVWGFYIAAHLWWSHGFSAFYLFHWFTVDCVLIGCQLISSVHFYSFTQICRQFRSWSDLCF